MNVTQFEHLIEAGNLHHLGTIASQLRFIVSYRYETQFGTRFQGDTLAFGRDEFLAMSEQEAVMHIGACKARLERAAKTMQGDVRYSEAQERQQTLHTPTPVLTTINYPAH